MSLNEEGIGTVTVNGITYDIRPNADLEEADLEEADLEGANLEGAQLRKQIYAEQI